MVNSEVTVPGSSSAAALNLTPQSKSSAPRKKKLQDLKLQAERIADRLIERRYKIPVRYPSQTEIIRIAPAEKHHVMPWPLVEDPADGEVYLFAPEVWGECGGKTINNAPCFGFALA